MLRNCELKSSKTPVNFVSTQSLGLQELPPELIQLHLPGRPTGS